LSGPYRRRPVSCSPEVSSQGSSSSGTSITLKEGKRRFSRCQVSSAQARVSFEQGEGAADKGIASSALFLFSRNINANFDGRLGRSSISRKQYRMRMYTTYWRKHQLKLGSFKRNRPRSFLSIDLEHRQIYQLPAYCYLRPVKLGTLATEVLPQLVWALYAGFCRSSKLSIDITIHVRFVLAS
jgi:hypothetical protein